MKGTPSLSIAARFRAPAVCLTALLVVVAQAGAQVIDRVLAVVGPKVVTLSDVRSAEAFGIAETMPAATAASGVLGSLVGRELILGEVDRSAAPDPEPAAFERRFAQVRARFATAELYEQALARTAMTDSRLRSIVADNLRIESYLEQRFGTAAQPTLDEVQRYYREHQGEFTRAGRLLPFDEVQAAVRQKLTAERRRELIADWLERLGRRGQVEILQRAPVIE